MTLETSFVITEEQDKDPADGWLSSNRKPNGVRVREDFEVDERLSSTNTDFGGKDPAKVEDRRVATFDPEAVYEEGQL